MTETIPVSLAIRSLAIRAVERAIRECDAATPGPWFDAAVEVVIDSHRFDLWTSTRSDERFAILARAEFRASLEYLYWSLHDFTWVGEPLVHEKYAAVAPLIQHYDATRPGWRTE